MGGSQGQHFEQEGGEEGEDYDVTDVRGGHVTGAAEGYVDVATVLGVDAHVGESVGNLLEEQGFFLLALESAGHIHTLEEPVSSTGTHVLVLNI